MQEIYSLSASNLIREITSQKLSVADVSNAFINRIKQVNPSLNAIHQCDAERILYSARIADSMIACL